MKKVEPWTGSEGRVAASVAAPNGERFCSSIRNGVTRHHDSWHRTNLCVGVTGGGGRLRSRA